MSYVLERMFLCADGYAVCATERFDVPLREGDAVHAREGLDVSLSRWGVYARGSKSTKKSSLDAGQIMYTHYKCVGALRQETQRPGFVCRRYLVK